MAVVDVEYCHCHLFVAFLQFVDEWLFVKSVGLSYAAFHKIAVYCVTKASFGDAYEYCCGRPVFLYR